MKGTGTTSLHVYFPIQHGKWERCSNTRAGAEYVKRPVFFLSFCTAARSQYYFFFWKGLPRRGVQHLYVWVLARLLSSLAILYAFAEAGICCSSHVAPLCLGSSDLRIRLFGELVLSIISYEHLYVYTLRKDELPKMAQRREGLTGRDFGPRMLQVNAPRRGSVV